MSIDAGHLLTYVIKPTLGEMYNATHHPSVSSAAAERLLLGTAAVESHMGRYLHQIGGPAVGIYQMEPATFYDILNNFLSFREPLVRLVYKMFLVVPKMKDIKDDWGLLHPSIHPSLMAGNLYFATFMARLHYLRVKEPLPPAHDIQRLAIYWKRYYNTDEGKGIVGQFVNAYEAYVGF